VCNNGKQSRLIFEKSNNKSIYRLLFVIYSDVCNPIMPSTIDRFVAKSEAHFNLKMVSLYIDNGR